MFDTSVRKIIDPVLDRIGNTLASMGITANAVTWSGFAIGAGAAISISQGALIVGLVLLLLSRLLDGLDGAVARSGKPTDLGGFLDIVLDFAFYGMIPFAFILLDPDANAHAGALLLLIFYINGASFLTFALMAEKQGLDENARGKKSLLYTAGLAEGTETIVVFVLFCLFPAWFSVLAVVFSIIVAITTVTRFIMAYQTFR